MFPKPISLSVSLILLGSGSSAAAPFQDTLVVVEKMCTRCSIEVHRVARIGAVDDATGPAEFVWASRDADGNFYISPSVDYSGVLRYDSAGRLTGTIGRQGEGPGEFRLPGDVTIGSGDMLYAFDRGNYTLSVFGPDAGFIRETRIGIQVDGAYAVGDGRVVVQGELPTSSGIGMPAHLIDREGALIRSFGAYEEVVDPRVSLSRIRAMGPAKDGSVWLARLNRYEIDRWSLEGEHEITLLRDANWFEEYPADEPSGSPKFERPTPMIRGVWQDDSGHLWVVARVAASDWEPEGRAPPGAQPVPPIGESARYYDTVIEVIDLAGGRVIARTRMRHHYLQRVAEPGLLVGRSSDESGLLLLVDLYEVALTGT